MIIKIHTHNDYGKEVWIIHDNVDRATTIDAEGAPGKDINFWKHNGAHETFSGVDEAYLMNDRGQTIERLA